MEVVRPFKVVKAHDRHITRNLKPSSVKILHQSYHGSIVPSENRRWFQRQKPIKRFRVLASVMNQGFVNREAVITKSSFISIHPLERGRHMRSAGDHGNTAMT